MFFNQTVEADGSCVKVSSEDAKRMALETLEWVKRRRQEAKEGAIKREMKSIDDGFWHKLFRMKPATREDAIASLESNEWDFDYHFTHIIGSKHEDTAHRILNACKHASEIYISTEDLRRIS